MAARSLFEGLVAGALSRAWRGSIRGYRGYGYRGVTGGTGRGRPAAVGLLSAAAAGAYYRGGCGYDAYGNWICPNGY